MFSLEGTAAKAILKPAAEKIIEKGIEKEEEKIDEKISEHTGEKSNYAKEVGDIVRAGLSEIKFFSPEQLQNKKIEKNDIVREKLSDIKCRNPEQLKDIPEDKNSDSLHDEVKEIKEKLTDEEKIKIKEESGWSDEIIDAINSMEEYEIYKKAGLTEAEINGKKCLVRNDIDWNQKDGIGRTNEERIKMGLAPLDKSGKPIEMHHIGQRADGPLAELTNSEHHKDGNDGILHNKTLESEIDRHQFAKERTEHWKTRATQLGGIS